MSYDDDEQTYGTDLPRDARRWARQELGGQLNSIQQQLQKQAVETSRQRCMAALDADSELRDKWRKLNQDHGFLSWLGEIYELAGVPRQQLLTQAYDLGDTDRVRNFFRAYLVEKIPQRQRTAERLPYETTGPKTAVRASKDAHEARRRIWSKSDIAKFYDDVRRGRYDQREEERLRIEAEIFTAAKQGRMAPDAVQPRDSKGPLF